MITGVLVCPCCSEAYGFEFQEVIVKEEKIELAKIKEEMEEVSEKKTEPEKPK